MMMKAELRIKNYETPSAARPIDVARALYATRGWDFEKTLLGYLRSDVGYVFHGPSFFALARPVMLANERAAWHVDVAVGRLETLLGMVPFDLPFISFHRDADGPLRIYETERLRKLAQQKIAKGKQE